MSRFDIHFPFKEMREDQKKILEWIDSKWDNYRYIIVESPTGTGKSPIAKTLARSSNNAFILTATKQLQDQYIKDFKGKDFISIKGRANYSCFVDRRLNCECGPCMLDKKIRINCIINKKCPYYNIREQALASNAVLTSYQYFLYSTTCGGFWKPRETIILDEAHLTESQLVQWATINIIPEELKNTCGIIIKNHIPTGNIKDSLGWLNDIWSKLCTKREELRQEIIETYRTSASVITAELAEYEDCNNINFNLLSNDELEEVLLAHSEYYKIDKIFRRFVIFFESKDKEDNWICQSTENGIVLTPILTDKLFSKYVDSFTEKRIIFLSATILNIKSFCKDLGIDRSQVAALRCESKFPPEKSPIIHIPSGSINYSNIEYNLPNIINNVKNIMEKHENEKGIIHTGNYRIAKAIYDNIQSDRFIMKINNESNEMLLKMHELNSGPTILISPSLTTGADLKDDLSRFQIIIKMPWTSLADPRIKKRANIDNDWYTTDMIRSFVQAAGRSTRSEDDWCVTYVLDGSFKYWINKCARWLPKKFLERIKY